MKFVMKLANIVIMVVFLLGTLALGINEASERANKRPDFVWHIANQNPDTFIGWGTGAVKNFFSSPRIVEDDDYFIWCAVKDGDNVNLIFNKGTAHSITTWFTLAVNKKDNITEVRVYDNPLKVEVDIEGLLAEIENVAGFLRSADFISEVTIGK